VFFDQLYFEFFQSGRLELSFFEEMRPLVFSQLRRVAKLMTTEDRDGKVVNLIIDCIVDEEDEERRLTGILMLDELLEVVGADSCTNYILYELVAMQDDASHKIRRELVLKLPHLAAVLGNQIFVGVLLPVFRKLSQDAMWSVRKACVDVLA
jgi:hypothetical protein